MSRSGMKVSYLTKIKAAQLDSEIPADVAHKFHELAKQQRGAPEKAMLDFQHYFGGGVLSGLLEHVGDLIHRMTEGANKWGFGRKSVKEKVDRALHYLQHPYGFAREHKGNLKNNYEYGVEHNKWGKGFTLAQFEQKVNALLGKYVDEHKKLKPLNEIQRLANDATIALGSQNFKEATSLLLKLKAIVDNKGQYLKMASSWDKSNRPLLSST